MLDFTSSKNLFAGPSLSDLGRSFRLAYEAWLPIAVGYFTTPEPDREAFLPKLRRGAPARRRAVKKIIATPPDGTIQDVAVKAMAAAHETAHLWSDPAASLPSADRAMRSLIESCAALTGIAVPTIPGRPVSAVVPGNPISKIVRWVAKWHAARAAAAAAWAQEAVEQTGSYAALDHLQKAHEIEDELVCSAPQSRADACAMQGMLVDILLYRQQNPDPNDRLTVAQIQQISQRVHEWLEMGGHADDESDREVRMRLRLADLGLEPAL